jgi:hypothetical protein
LSLEISAQLTCQCAASRLTEGETAVLCSFVQQTYSVTCLIVAFVNN